MSRYNNYPDGYDFADIAEDLAEARGTSAECDEGMYADWVGGR